MSRSQRLLLLLQVLRRYRHPVSGSVLAEETGVSLRTLYRDISTLQAQGADIEGEAGVGYILRPGYMLPPLMLTAEELEAVMLGIAFVRKRADRKLAVAAANAIAKIEAVLPEELRQVSANATILAGPGISQPEEVIDVELIKVALRTERAMTIAYRDLKNRRSRRTVWPVALTYFEGARVLIAWCTLRHDFRHFRTDRIETAELSSGRYSKRRASLLKAWKQANAISDSE